MDVKNNSVSSSSRWKKQLNQSDVQGGTITNMIMHAMVISFYSHLFAFNANMSNIHALLLCQFSNPRAFLPFKKTAIFSSTYNVANIEKTVTASLLCCIPKI